MRSNDYSRTDDLLATLVISVSSHFFLFGPCSALLTRFFVTKNYTEYPFLVKLTRADPSLFNRHRRSPNQVEDLAKHTSKSD